MRTQSGGWAGAAPTGPSSSIVSDRQPHRGHANQAVDKAKKKKKKKKPIIIRIIISTCSDVRAYRFIRISMKETQTNMYEIMMMMMAVISIAPNLTDKGEYTTIYKSNNNVYIKTSKIIYIVILSYSSYTTHTHTGAQKECN